VRRPARGRDPLDQGRDPGGRGRYPLVL